MKAHIRPWSHLSAGPVRHRRGGHLLQEEPLGATASTEGIRSWEALSRLVAAGWESGKPGLARVQGRAELGGGPLTCLPGTRP